MKRHLLTAALALIATLTITTTANAAPPITVNGGAGYWMFDSDRELESSGTPWIGLEYAWGDYWSTELMYTNDDANLENGGGKVDVQSWQLDMMRYVGDPLGSGRTNYIRPYFVFGGGEIDIDEGSWDTVETQVNVGAGFRYMLTNRFGVRADARVLHSLDEHENDLLFSAGLNWYFGDVTPPAPAAAPAPVDSDGDGVTDDRDQCPGTPAGTRVDATGCPLPVAKVASIRLLVNFAFDSSQVQERYFQDIAGLADFLQKFDDLNVEVEGHTDSQGPDDYNQSLSQRRAQAVVDVLVNQHGISASRLQAVGYGESRPVETNETDAGRAKNRRVMATLEVEYEE